MAQFHCVSFHDTTFYIYFNVILAIFDLNNDEKRQPDLEKASWLATIKVSLVTSRP